MLPRDKDQGVIWVGRPKWQPSQPFAQSAAHAVRRSNPEWQDLSYLVDQNVQSGQPDDMVNDRSRWIGICSSQFSRSRWRIWSTKWVGWLEYQSQITIAVDNDWIFQFSRPERTSCSTNLYQTTSISRELLNQKTK